MPLTLNIMHSLSRKTNNVNFFVILIMVFFDITTFLFPYPAYANVIFSNNDSSKKNASQIKIDDIFHKLQNFTPILEPKAEFSDKNENTATFQQYRDNFLIVYFWASWCNSCKEELSQLNKLIDEFNYRSVKNATILPISIDYKTTDQILEVYDSLKLKNIPIFKDDNKEAMDSMKVKSLPTTFFINKEGYIIFKHEGTLYWNNEYFITKLINTINTHATVTEPSPKKEDDITNKANIIPTQDKPLKKKPIIIN